MEKVKFNENKANNLLEFFKRNFLSLKNINKILFILIIALGICYVAKANDLAIKGYALSDLKARFNKLAGENKKLELRAMALSSYGVISEKVSNLKMVAVGEINYIHSDNEMVAKK